ncbi:MAG: glycine cleavage system aminomethyltransferase GcvT [Parachlamydiaceae bacterium]|nr:glycine cleavage system aminomethyltransferase GcvT [Parachlamydiaceae bacterium]
MKTILYDLHKSLGAQFVDFGGWEMPLQYIGILQEHAAVRAKIGLFDVSHMGRIGIEGPDAERFIDYLSSNKIAGKKELTATYTVLCSEKGTAIDDTIIYRINNSHFFIIANASNRQKDLDHLLRYSKDFKVSIIPYFNDEGILAVQGPLSKNLITRLFPEGKQLEKVMHFMKIPFRNRTIFLSSTGYTGAGGYEIYAPLTLITELWELLLKEGIPEGIVPVGLGARNTLRLEMGYALYGHEIDDTISPTESVAAWCVKLDQRDFLGKSALLALESSEKKRFSYGIVLTAPGVARDTYLLFKEGQEIGKVTSGAFSPTLNKSICLVMTQRLLNLGDHVEVQIRNRRCPAEVTKIPFLN